MLGRTVDVTIAALQFVVCVLGLGSNVLICVVIRRHRQTVFTSSFYAFAVPLALADCVHLLSELLCALPAVFYGLERTSKPFLYSCGFLADASFWALAPLMLVIAVNRYLAVAHFDAYKRWFTPGVIRALVAICVLLSLLVPTVMYACTCYYDFRYAWLFVCQGSCKQQALDMNTVVATSICAGITLIYITIIVQHRLKQRSFRRALADDDLRRRKVELRLVFQFGLICFVLVSYLTFFWLFSLVAKNDAAEAVLNLFENVNSCCSSFLYLAFSSEIRNYLPWKTGRNVTVALTDAVSRARTTNLRPVSEAPVGGRNGWFSTAVVAITAHNQSTDKDRTLAGVEAPGRF